MHQAWRNVSIIRQGMWADVGWTAHLGRTRTQAHMKLSFHSDAGNTGDWWGQKRTESCFNRNSNFLSVMWRGPRQKNTFGYLNNIWYLNGLSPPPTLVVSKLVIYDGTQSNKWTYLTVLQLRAVLSQCGVQELVLLCGLDHPTAVGQRRLGADTEDRTMPHRRRSRLTGPVWAGTPSPRCQPAPPLGAAGTQCCSQ